jgi:Na+/pantothenate symporter
LGGFRVSFITDNIQGVMISLLVLICAIAVGTSVEIDTSKIGPSGLTQPTLLGYQLIYILLVGILFSDMFISGFWMRAFAAKTDKDLWIGCGIASIFVFVILLLISSTGFIAAWAGVWTPPEYGGLAFFLLLDALPSWVIGVVIIMVVALSCAGMAPLHQATRIKFNSLQYSTVSSQQWCQQPQPTSSVTSYL